MLLVIVTVTNQYCTSIWFSEPAPEGRQAAGVLPVGDEDLEEKDLSLFKRFPPPPSAGSAFLSPCSMEQKCGLMVPSCGHVFSCKMVGEFFANMNKEKEKEKRPCICF